MNQKQLKRMLGAAIQSTDLDNKLISLGENPETLRKQLHHLIQNDKLTFYYERIMLDCEKNVISKIKEDKIIFSFDSEYWGDGWGGDYDTQIII